MVPFGKLLGSQLDTLRARGETRWFQPMVRLALLRSKFVGPGEELGGFRP